jgi:NADH-quinone oxidoreductase subunit L
MVLASGAIFSGVLGHTSFVGEEMSAFWAKSILILENHHAMEGAEHVPALISRLPTLAGVGGIALAYVMYMFVPVLPGHLYRLLPAVHKFVYNKWYFDELYDFLFVRPAFKLGRAFWQGGDGALIDGVGPDGVAAATKAIARKVGALQSGYLYHYAFAMLIGVAAFVTWYIVKVG